MQILQGKEEKLCNRTEFLLATDFRGRFRANNISSKTGSILMIDEICWVDTLPFLILHVGDSLAQTQQTRITVDEGAIMRELAVLLVV